MSSPAGRALHPRCPARRPGRRNAGTCSAYAAGRIDVILRRVSERVEPAPGVETVIDQVVAPMMYRILFRPDGLDTAHAHRLVAGVLSR